MAKLAPTSIKYVIRATIKAKGVVEKPDVIGAIFGQTEGLLGSELDLRELQRTGRIGRIEVNIKSVQGKSEGEIIIPSSLDSAETSLIAAALETIERVGPCAAEIQLQAVEDTRASKREYVLDRAKDILKNLMETSAPETAEVSEKIKEAVRTHEISSYHGLPCGPNITESEEIIVVEGRADVLNLLKYGVKNTIAVEGTSIPSAVIELSKEKTVTLFVDGDRGGQLIAREFMQKMDVDFIAMAPEGKEVEELTQKEVYKSLRNKMTAEQFLAEVPEKRMLRERRGRMYERKPSGRGRERKPSGRGRRPERPPRMPKLTQKDKEKFRKVLEDLVGTRAACIYNEKGELLGKVPVAELENTLKTMEKSHTVVFDGKVDFKLAETARKAGVRFLIGMEKENIRLPVAVFEKKDLA